MTLIFSNIKKKEEMKPREENVKQTEKNH